MDLSDKEISDVADKIARMIVTEGEILTETLWAINVAEIIAQHRDDIANAPRERGAVAHTLDGVVGGLDSGVEPETKGEQK